MIRRAGRLGCVVLTLVFASAPATAVATSPPTAPAPDRLAGVNWLAGPLPSPCGAGDVDLIGGTALVAGRRVVLEDVRPLDPGAGLAVLIMSCQPADGVVSARTVAVVEVAPGPVMTTRTERLLPLAGRIVSVDLPELIVETPVATVPPSDEAVPADAGSSSSAPPAVVVPLVRRHVVTISSDAITIADRGEVPATTPDPGPGAAPGVVASTFVRTSVPAAALCFRWGDPPMYPQDPPDEPEPPREPRAELQSARLGLMHVTDRWIAPASEMTTDMGDVVRAYQEARGLAVDGVLGRQTGAALAADLGCPEGLGELRQVEPPALGPRRFGSVGELTASMARYADAGHSGNPSFDALLARAGWDGSVAMFLGCHRRDSPRAGLDCTWSGVTPLQLVGLVDDPATEGVTAFSVLYARSPARP